MLIEELLRFQVEEIGFRATGTRGSQNLVRSLTDRLSALGLDCVEDQFPIEILTPSPVSLSVGGQCVPSLPYFGAPGFLGRGQDGQVLAYLVELPPDFQPEDAAGKIVLSRAATGDWPGLVERLGATGCSGLVLVVAAGQDDPLRAPVSSFLHPDLTSAAAWPEMPVVGIANSDAEILLQGANSGQQIALGAKTQRIQGVGRHVSAGRKNDADGPETTWLICHHDSAYENPDVPAATDNGTGVAAVMAAVTQMVARDGFPKDLRVIFYDAEEYGLYGCLSLLVDLTGLSDTTDAAPILQRLSKGDIASSYIRSLPRTVIEVDTVGRGDVLDYGTTAPDLVAELLRANHLGSTFSRIRLSPMLGNLERMARLLGLAQNTEFHFLTLESSPIVHTPLDNMSAVNLPDVVRVADFLADLVPLLDQRSCQN